MTTVLSILISGACGVTSRSIAYSLRFIYGKNIRLIGMGVARQKYALFENIYDVFYIVPAANNPHYWSSVQVILNKELPDCALIIP